MMTQDNITEQQGDDELRMDGGSFGVPATGGDSSKPTKLFNRGTLMMGLMFLVGVGWVFYESQKIKFEPPTAKEQANAALVQSGVDSVRKAALSGPERRQSTKEMIEAFTYDAKQRQIPQADLKKNPFVTFAADKDVAKDSGKATGDSKDAKGTKTPKETSEEPVVKGPTKPSAPNLKLQSVIMGPNPTAMISGKLVRKGQVIKGWTVTDIQPRKVVLRLGKYRYELKMKP